MPDYSQLTYQLLKDYLSSKNIISTGDSRPPYQQFTFTVTAGDQLDVFEVFDYFRVLTLSANTLQVRFGENGLFTDFISAGIGLKCENKFSRLTLKNTGGVDITVTIALALGTVNDDRLTISGTVSISGLVQTFQSEATALETSQISVANVATRLDNFATGATPAQITIAAGTADLYIGKDNTVTTANGFLIPAGGSYTSGNFGLTSQIWGIRTGAGAVTAYAAKENY